MGASFFCKGAGVKLENLVILGLSVALWGMWWKRNGRRLKRLLKSWQARLPRHYAKSEEACPHCQAKAQVTVKRLQTEGVPYVQIKSRRGRRKGLNTEGYACPNPECAYFRIRDAGRHALAGYGKDGQQHIQPSAARSAGRRSVVDGERCCIG